MTSFVALIPKTYSYLTDDNDKNKKEKAQKSALSSENLNSKIMNIV